MPGAADKARFHLERAVPQLHEFEDKQIFSQDEIRILVKKRSDFEHRIIAPGAPASSFLDYVRWELSLETLRVKRSRRLHLAPASTLGAAPSRLRTVGIFERAVSRHPGELAIWRAYLDFCAEARQARRWHKVVVRALRLHPECGELWARAGRRAAGGRDMQRARDYFMRGCRFCVRDATVWLEYARCEMEWLERIGPRKKEGNTNGAGLEAVRAAEGAGQDIDFIALDDDDDDDDETEVEEESGLVLPDIRPEETAGETVERKLLDEEAVKKLERSPVLEGAIPLAIFSSAQKQSFFNAAVAEGFYDVFVPFTKVGAQERIIDTVLGVMQERYPNDAATWNCWVRRPLVSVPVLSGQLPRVLRQQTLSRLREGLEKTEDQAGLAGKTVAWLEPLIAVEGLDVNLRTVLEHMKQKMERMA